MPHTGGMPTARGALVSPSSYAIPSHHHTRNEPWPWLNIWPYPIAKCFNHTPPVLNLGCACRAGFLTLITSHTKFWCSALFPPPRQTTSPSTSSQHQDILTSRYFTPNLITPSYHLPQLVDQTGQSYPGAFVLGGRAHKGAPCGLGRDHPLCPQADK